MKPALQDLQLESPLNWQQLPQGKFVQKQIERHLNPWWPQVFGYHLLKVGALSSEINTSVCPIKHQINLAGVSGDKQGIIADIHHLPFRENSVDAVLLAHTLDFTHDPHQVLREAHRAVLANGYIFITGFNPFSLTGLFRFFPKLKHSPIAQSRFFNPNRIRDWLNLLGCEVVADQRFIYGSLSKQPSNYTKRWIPGITHQYLSHFGAVYLLVARKRELPLTPTKAKWKVKPKLQPVGQGVRIRSGIRSSTSFK
ncbi:class I SAM-dependent methyltransferase [Catenovulum sp. 2E275]|uniref:class I SAM-dependent methyltransferase n=1 Tax=Catenovulum sp. 2E275 TaxID=2980497 RepID=UPI0021D13A20|nr:class I SAM-dependent methyltransferase [Catenovulum sp. 2E275]MCU4674853.1 class I SAM-dependent methyltransferase [Catenovulum sp. 2E275]